MAKLPTTFQTLDVSGFHIEEKQYSAVTREMVDTACAVLQKNRIGVVIRSVQAAIKGSRRDTCKMGHVVKFC